VVNVFENIRFKCKRCGSCCHYRRPKEFNDLIPLKQIKEFWEKSNLIYLTEKDIERISQKTKLAVKDFIDTLYEYNGKLIRVEGAGSKVILDFPVMRSKEDKTCIFYNEGCTIYSVRPRACRLFPFRVEEDETPEGDILLRIGINPNCPGVGKGNFVEKQVLERLVSDQFLQRNKSITSEIQELAAKNKIQKNAQIFRTFPGRLREIQELVEVKG
jgi:Fe-S-cluster containining protein